MLPTDKIAIKEFIKEKGYELEMFHFESVLERNLQITLRDHPKIKFEVRHTKASFIKFGIMMTEFSPGFPCLEFGNGATLAFEEVLNHLDDWLTIAGGYLEETWAENEWSQFEKAQDYDGNYYDEHTYLNNEEIKLVEVAVASIKKQINIQLNPISNQFAQIEEKLDYLIQSTDRLNKFDLKGAIFSTFVSIAINLGVDTETGKILFQIFRDAFQSMPGLYHTIKFLVGNQ